MEKTANGTVRAKRELGTFLALSPLLLMTVLAFVGVLKFKMDLKLVFILATGYGFALSAYRGCTYREMEALISEKIGKALPALLIILSIGIVIGAWIISGTVPMLIYYGVQLIHPKFFLITAFLVCATLSVATGSSWSSAGTAGLALIGIAEQLGIPLAYAAGAIISGASFGDKLSPLSETTNLAAVSAGVPLYTHIKSMLYTTVPATIIGCVVYFFMGMFAVDTTQGSIELSGLLQSFDSLYNWNILLLLPVAIILWGAIKKMPNVPIMIGSAFVAAILGVVFHGFSITSAATAMMSGFSLETMASTAGVDADWLAQVTKLLNRGGMDSMANLTILTILGNIFAVSLTTCGGVEKIIHVFQTKVNSNGQLIAYTLLGSGCMLAASGSAYAGMITLGASLQGVYEERDVDPAVLSRSLEDAGTMISALIPWSNTALYYIQLFGVSPLAYGIWTIPCYAGILVALFYGYSGKCIPRIRAISSM